MILASRICYNNRMTNKEKPLLLLDIDGVLLPFAPSSLYVWHPEMQVYWSPYIKDALARLPFEIVWATMRGLTANIDVAPRHGLPPLDAVDFSDMDLTDQTFKLAGIKRYVGDRQVVWMDDHIYEDGMKWADDRDRSIPTMAIQVDPYRGFTTDHIDKVLEFAAFPNLVS